jgi:hypothetical protein
VELLLAALLAAAVTALLAAAVAALLAAEPTRSATATHWSGLWAHAAHVPRGKVVVSAVGPRAHPVTWPDVAAHLTLTLATLLAAAKAVVGLVRVWVLSGDHWIYAGACHRASPANHPRGKVEVGALGRRANPVARPHVLPATAATAHETGGCRGSGNRANRGRGHGDSCTGGSSSFGERIGSCVGVSLWRRQGQGEEPAMAVNDKARRW